MCCWSRIRINVFSSSFFRIHLAASKCSDDRLKPYNGSCYLFVSYPEVDWMTAQQVCAGIHGELATVTTAEEQRFIITNLRNELDYSPQTIYWLGGKLEANKYLKWIDGSNVTYKVSVLSCRTELEQRKTEVVIVCVQFNFRVGLDSRSKKERKNIARSTVLGITMESFAVTNATIGSFLDDRPLLEVRWIHLQETQPRRCAHVHCESNNHRHRWPSLIAK